MNHAVQYTIVAVIILLACAWIVWKVIKRSKSTGDDCSDSPGCSGCALSDACNKKRPSDTGKPQR